jgi:hypothetical protein
VLHRGRPALPAGPARGRDRLKLRRLGELSGTALTDEHRAIGAAMSRVEIPEFAWDLQAISAVDPALPARLREHWAARLRVEHRSSMVFGQLAAQLFEASAYLDEQVVMMRMAQDELRHTGTCAAVLTALGGSLEASPPELEPLARHAGVSAEERALRNVIFTTCVSEMVACARFVATLDHTTDPMMRAALRVLLSDEALHGRFGFHYLEVRADALTEPGLAASLERFLVHAFAVAERELAPARPWRPSSEGERAYGLEDPELAHEVFHQTLEHAVVPGLERLGVRAEAAWRGRRLLV